MIDIVICFEYVFVDYLKVVCGKIGIFFVNFGMFDYYSYWFMCWYLNEFLFDCCVIDYVLWKW